METMPLQLVLEEMRKPVHGGSKPFDLIVCRWDNKTKTGGEPIYYQKARLKIWHRANSAEGSAYTPAKENAHKNPNHWKHQTRNVILPNGLVRKIHIRDITHFNGKKVHW